jgi:short-subunit dehydrogenase
MESTQKYVLITSASSGIGQHSAEVPAKNGYSIVAVSSQPTQLDNLKKRLEYTYQIIVVAINIDLIQENSA